MSKFGEESNQSLNEAQAHARGESPVIAHISLTPREARREEVRALATMDGLDLSDRETMDGAWYLTR